MKLNSIFTILTLKIIKMKNNFFLFLFLFIQYFSFAQQNKDFIVEYDNKIFNSKVNEFGMVINSDNKVLIKFGGIFVNEKVKVKNNGMVVLESNLKTNFSVSFCPKSEFKLNRYECNLIEIIFDNKTIRFELDEKYFYLRINKFENQIYLNYSNSPGTSH